MEEYMSGDQLREYLHMSKRKVKYLLENGFIPCVDTGKKTHRYLITYTDAKSFRKKLKANPNMLRSLEGCFSSRSTTPNKEKLTQEEAIEFKEYLTKRWESVPDVLIIKSASELTGIERATLVRLVSSESVAGRKLRGTLYISKEGLIAYLADPVMMFRYRSDTFRSIISDFCEQYGIVLQPIKQISE